jgi:hypothetical protein
MLMLAPLTSVNSAAPSLNHHMMFQALAERACSLTHRLL